MLTLVPFFMALRRCREPRDYATSLALGLYFVGVLLAALSGRFPVPLMGYGASPIMGYFMALAWLVRIRDC